MMWITVIAIIAMCVSYVLISFFYYERMIKEDTKAIEEYLIRIEEQGRRIEELVKEKQNEKCKGR